MFKKIVIITFIYFFFLCQHQNLTTEILCNEFNIISKIEGSHLIINIQTDLPDYTEIMVSVSRSYFEKGNSSEYPLDYFSEKNTIGKWREVNKIYLDNNKWKALLKKRQNELSRIGYGFETEKISDTIDISFSVPVNQSNKNFGKGNINLKGKEVTISNVNYIRKEKIIEYSLDSTIVLNQSNISLDPKNLDIKHIYVTSKETPLMPYFDSGDISDINLIKYIPVSGYFKVISKKIKTSNPWYKVDAYQKDGIYIGEGWINSIALIGQKLKVKE